MAELLIPPDARPRIDALLAAFLELLKAETTVYGQGPGSGAYTETHGIEAVEDLERIELDPDDVLAEMTEAVRRDFAARTMPAAVVYAGRAYMDEAYGVHLLLQWRQQP